MKQHKPGERHSVVDRMDREETMLKRRLADLDAEKPSLTAFYNSMTPGQKLEFGRAAHASQEADGMHMMIGMMGRPRPPEMGGRMSRGPMGSPGRWAMLRRRRRNNGLRHRTVIKGRLAASALFSCARRNKAAQTPA